MMVYGGEVHLDHPIAGNGYIGYSRVDAKDIMPLSDAIQVIHGSTGAVFKENYFGAAAARSTSFPRRRCRRDRRITIGPSTTRAPSTPCSSNTSSGSARFSARSATSSISRSRCSACTITSSRRRSCSATDRSRSTIRAGSLQVRRRAPVRHVPLPLARRARRSRDARRWQRRRRVLRGFAAHDSALELAQPRVRRSSTTRATSSATRTTSRARRTGSRSPPAPPYNNIVHADENVLSLTAMIAF